MIKKLTRTSMVLDVKETCTDCAFDFAFAGAAGVGAGGWFLTAGRGGSVTFESNSGGYGASAGEIISGLAKGTSPPVPIKPILL